MKERNASSVLIGTILALIFLFAGCGGVNCLFGYWVITGIGSSLDAKMLHGPGIGVIRIDGVIVVTTPQDLSLLDSSRSLEAFQQASVPVVGVVENMSNLICPHCGRPVEVFYRSERKWRVDGSDIATLGRVPIDLEISRGIHAGHPLLQSAPDAPQALVFQEIAAKLRSRLSQRNPSGESGED